VRGGRGATRDVSHQPDAQGGNLTVEWNADLNTLVGGRGAGKSAILESIRYALDLPVYSEDLYRADSVRHAIGSGGTITLLVERPGETSGKRYRIRRVFGEAPEVFEDGGSDALGIPPREVFGPDAEPIVLLQREIQEVSRDDSFRLRLLDVLVGEAAESAAKQVAATRSALETNGARLNAAHVRADQKAELDEKARSLDAEIAFFDDQGVSLKLDRHAKIQKDESALKRARKLVQDESLGGWLTELNGLATRFGNVHKRLSQLESDHADELAGSLATIEQVIADIEAARTLLSESLGKAGQLLEALGVDWALVTAPLLDELLRLERELGSKLEPERYLQLLREKDELLPKLQAVEGATVEIQALTQERLGLLRRLGEQRLGENRLRRETADEVNQRLDGKLRIEIGYKGQTEAWRTTLTAFFRGSGVTTEAVNRLVAPDSTDGAQLAAAAFGGAKDVVTAFDVTTAMADKIVDWVTVEHGKRLHELQLLAPDDSVSVQLIVDGKPRSLDHLSMGQRSTAILLLLFALEGRLLILDQPEDDLDQRFVFEDIVGLLRAQKGLSEPFPRRQVIAATHNPNIPVLGDAEQVLALQAEEGRVVVKTRSSIDDAEVRILLRAILEGGAEAFRRRAEKYGGVE
jgi:chromosome segregation protein